ncbi:MAG TPA: RNA polymerase sigma factor, partial [Pirellulales bacterium]|nr:RNA polymerase sigma factor [Pirellulales bacterium]
AGERAGRHEAENRAPGESAQVESAQPEAVPLDITQLVLDHHEILYRYAYRLTGSAADAEDLTQQTFLVAHQKLDQVRSAACVRGWLFTVLRNGYFKSRRRTLPLAAASLGFDLDTIAAAAVKERPIDSVELGRALAELTDEFKLVLLLFYFEQRSYREIADILDLPIGTVMSRLSRAKGHLRAKLFSIADDTGKVVNDPSGNGRDTLHA